MLDPILQIGREYQLAFTEDRISVTLLSIKEERRQFRFIDARKTFWYRDLFSQQRFIQFRTVEDIWCEFERVTRSTHLHTPTYRLTSVRKIDSVYTKQTPDYHMKAFVFDTEVRP